MFVEESKKEKEFKHFGEECILPILKKYLSKHAFLHKQHPTKQGLVTHSGYEGKWKIDSQLYKKQQAKKVRKQWVNS